MATPLKLSAQPRAGAGRTAVKQVKAQGMIPGIIYGKSVKPQNLQFIAKDITTLLSHAASENVLVDVEIKDGASPRTQLAILQQVQHHPVSRRVLHLDLHAVVESEVIHAHVPIESFGEPVGVKQGGGILDQSLRALEIECLPRALPEVIRVDVSHLKLNDALHVRELVLPEGVKTKADGGLTVFAVHEPAVVVEPVVAEVAAPTEPEAIKEKKPEAGAPAAAPAAPAAGEKKPAPKK
jgi:large subunit ribosomal protein L25